MDTRPQALDTSLGAHHESYSESYESNLESGSHIGHRSHEMVGFWLTLNPETLTLEVEPSRQTGRLVDSDTRAVSVTRLFLVHSMPFRLGG